MFKGETQPAMKMWLMEGESCGVGDYQSTMAQVCAAQIRDWLQAGQRGEALLMNGDDARPVRGVRGAHPLPTLVPSDGESDDARRPQGKGPGAEVRRPRPAELLEGLVNHYLFDK